MPKPNQNQMKKNNWKNQYLDLDFRSGETRRVSFKSSRCFSKQDRHKDWGSSIRAHLADEDVDMGTSVSNARYNSKKFNRGKRGNRSGSPAPHRGTGRRKLLEGPIDWYRIYIPFGNKYDKQFVQQALLDKITPTPLIPIMWVGNGNAVSFYVDDFKTAEKLNNIDREIQLPDGFKMIIRVNNGAPNVDVNSAMKDKMKLAMAKRYNAETKALDLSKFHLEPELRDFFCALFKPIILLAALDIISENIPELEALSLNDNKIQILSHLKRLPEKLPHLNILYLGSNKLRDMSHLDVFIGVHLKELYLNGNPLCDKFKDQASYVSEVRKKFPKLLRLDGTDLPPPISFDIEEVSIPPSQKMFLKDKRVEALLGQFIGQYFEIMDSDNRQALLPAYHDNAMFSMTMAYPYGQHPKNAAWLNWYSTDNRNLQRVTDPDRRMKLLKQGNVNVVAFLQEMPQSKHDIQNFTVDVTLNMPQLIVVTITGLFREVKSSHKIAPIRYFCRTLAIVPVGSGLCIANEQLHISNATDALQKVAFKTVLPPIVPPTPNTSPTVAEAVPDTTKQQMIQMMSQESGMNLVYSQKCLEESQWNFQKAAETFTNVKALGRIPVEAFVK